MFPTFVHHPSNLANFHSSLFQKAFFHPRLLPPPLFTLLGWALRALWNISFDFDIPLAFCKWQIQLQDIILQSLEFYCQAKYAFWDNHAKQVNKFLELVGFEHKNSLLLIFGCAHSNSSSYFQQGFFQNFQKRKCEERHFTSMHPWKLFMIPTNIKINRKGFPHKSASNSNAHCSMLYSISIHMGAHCLFYFCQERRRKEVTNFCCKNNNRRNLQEKSNQCYGLESYSNCLQLFSDQFLWITQMKKEPNRLIMDGV